MARPAAACLAWMVVIACATPLAAAPSSSSPRNAEALALFRKSEAAYHSGQFADAVALLRRAYQISSTPILQYNLARALEGLEDLPAAIEAYETYLRTEPEIVDRPALERRVAALKRQIAERESLRREREAALQAKRAAEAKLLTTPPPPARRSLHPAPWAMLGAGLVVVATGGALVGAAVYEHDRALDDPLAESAARHQLSADRLALSGNVCFGVGAALSVSGLIWGIVDAVQKRRR